MITNVEITGVGSYAVDESTKKYVLKKIGSLERLAPRHARKSMHADVKLAEVNRDKGNKYEVEVILTVPDRRLTAKDSTMNILAAIDIVEAKLASQLRKYKQETVPHVGRRKLLDRFKRSYAREQ
ncbi:MAG: ribosome-associated translation inhibitor RaiA [Candidatus Saccharimonas aalborgensis]